jgi:hypothetical protein
MRAINHLLLCLAVTQFSGCTVRNNLPPARVTPPRTEPVVITAQAKMVPRGDWIYLIIADASHRYELMWAKPPHFSRNIEIEANRVYTFTIVEEKSVWSSLFTPRIAKVEENGLTIYDREVCEVHQIKMERKKVPILYGLFRESPGEPAAQVNHELFPHRHDVVLGGCVVERDSPKTDRIYVCRQCRDAYARWKAENPKIQFQ